MILTHFVAGAAICRHVKWRAAGLGLALLSHFALDATPHFEGARLVEPEWQSFARWVPRVLCLLLAPLMWVLWRRAGRPARGYLILAGWVACLPDLLFTVFGHRSAFGLINDVPHRLWAATYRLMVAEHGLWSPLAAPLAIALELTVLILAGWLLFRNGRNTTEVRSEGD
jgi:hypothetical protein